MLPVAIARIGVIPEETWPETWFQGISGFVAWYLLQAYQHSECRECRELQACSAQGFQYERAFSKGLKGAGREEAKSEIDSLFTNKVDKDFYNLVAFSAELLDL